MFTKKTLLSACRAAILAASPILAASAVAQGDGSDGVASLLMYSSTDCSGDGEAFQASGTSEQACFGPGGDSKQSLAAYGNNCTVTTWSGPDCAGTATTITLPACAAGAYSSVAVQCS